MPTYPIDQPADDTPPYVWTPMVRDGIAGVNDHQTRLNALEAGGGVPDDGSVTNAKVATNAAIDLDKTVDSATRLAMSAAERTKLAGVASGATAYTTEQARDDAAAMLTAGLHTNVSATYVDASGRLDLALSGTIATARLGSGTANSSSYLRGDQTYSSEPVTSTSVDLIVALTQAAYDALGTKDSRTFYVITG